VEAHLRRVSGTVSAYVASVCDSLKRSVPKAVVHCQVLQAKKSLLAPLYQQIGAITEDQLEQLLGGASPCLLACLSVSRLKRPEHDSSRADISSCAEDPEAVQERAACTQRLAMLRKARDEIAAATM
jgi:dynamin GTPase